MLLQKLAHGFPSWIPTSFFKKIEFNSSQRSIMMVGAELYKKKKTVIKIERNNNKIK